MRAWLYKLNYSMKGDITSKTVDVCNKALSFKQDQCEVFALLFVFSQRSSIEHRSKYLSVLPLIC